MTVAYIGGTFDLFHYGHVALFRAAKERYDKVVVSLNTDQFVAQFKRQTIMRLGERMEVVAACRYVDLVVVNWGCEDSKPAILEAGTTHFVHGSDWVGGSLMKQLGTTEEWFKEKGIEIVFLPYTATISTSDIIKRIRQ